MHCNEKCISVTIHILTLPKHFRQRACNVCQQLVHSHKHRSHNIHNLNMLTCICQPIQFFYIACRRKISRQACFVFVSRKHITGVSDMVRFRCRVAPIRCSMLMVRMVQSLCMNVSGMSHSGQRKEKKRKKKKRKDYAFWRQFNEKPSVIPGCPGTVAEQEGTFWVSVSFMPACLVKRAKPASSSA